jgi:NAD(P)-dependent dehydrogenase (short-subunit alcohol dehydrogenase family)
MTDDKSDNTQHGSRLKGSAVVTGSSRGIGRAVAAELAMRGYDVVATMRNPADGDELLAECSDVAGSIRVERLDITDPGDFAFPEDLSVLVNNAAIRKDYLPVEETSIDEWRDVFESNVFAPLELVRRAIPVMRSNGGGVICNVSSSAILGPKPFFGTYSGSKAALSAVSESLALELEPFGIRVVDILPGPIETDLSRSSVMYRPPDAIRFDAYRPQAEKWAQPTGMVTTSAEDAAAAIANAIESDDQFNRAGCDPMSVAILDQSRKTNDIERMHAARKLYGLIDL